MTRPPLHMRRTPSGLVPAHAIDAEALEAYGIGAEVEITVKQRRSDPAHRFLFAFLGKLVQSGAVPFKSTEALLDACKLALDFTELRRDVRGRYFVVPRSISYAKADQAEFKAFADAVYALVAERYGVTPEMVGLAA